MSRGQILEIIADPAAEKDIKKLVKRLGLEFLDVQEKEFKIHFFIKKLN